MAAHFEGEGSEADDPVGEAAHGFEGLTLPGFSLFGRSNGMGTTVAMLDSAGALQMSALLGFEKGCAVRETTDWICTNRGRPAD
jgi:hypothetical protein